MRITAFLTLLLLLFAQCKEAGLSEPTPENKNTISSTSKLVSYASGFQIIPKEGYILLEVYNPWPEADVVFRYALYTDNDKAVPKEIQSRIKVPVERMVVTSTTHIPSLEALEAESVLVGFPQTNYVSSPKTRALIDSGKVLELGGTQDINLELLINSQPEVVVGFGVDGDNKTLDRIQETGINVVYNGDWVEQDPLGKAEWIKFFGALLDKGDMAKAVFDSIANEYNRVKGLAASVTERQKVISGAMYKDIWYLPKGDSWAARFLKDASSSYYYQDTEGSGSLSLSLEAVLEKAQDAQVWIGPGQFTSLQQMLESNAVYGEFEAFKKGQVYSFTNLKGPTGGVIYYELAPNRPDLVLKDMIKILHPQLLEDHELAFFRKLE